jgi:hypothetical protein
MRPAETLTYFFLISAPLQPAWAAVVGGPVTNPSNGHRYYLLAPTTWKASEEEAVSLGGHLVAINDPAEQDWVWLTFSDWAGLPRSLYIGINDETAEGTFVWASGETVRFTRWSLGEPNSGEGLLDEDYGMMFCTR